MSEPLIEQESPFGNIVAVAEDDGRAVYFYLHYPEREEDDPAGPPMKVCWVRNRLPSPAARDDESLEQGLPPLMPAAFCKSPAAGPPLENDNLSVVWFEEADAAALLEGDEILAAIPAWGGEEGFCGYARDCIGQGEFAWELGDDNDIHERVRRAGEFWSLWDDDGFWEKWRGERIAALEAVLGPHAKYYAIDGGEFPPKALLRFDLPDRFVLATVGLALFCQPSVERHYDDPSPYRRVELGASLDRRCSPDEVKAFGAFLSAVSQHPWKGFTFLASGHTVDCRSTPRSCGGSQFPAALLSDQLPGVPRPALPAFRDDPVNLLWMYPVTAAERALAMHEGTDRLLNRLARAGHDGVIRARKPVA